MTTQRLVKRMNKMLLDELGESPIYAWKWSEDLKWGMLSGYTHVANRETGLLELRPVYTPRKMLVTVDKRWLMCFLAPPIPYKQWLNMFGWKAEWPNNGLWTPVNAPVYEDTEGRPHGGMVMLLQGEIPGETVTREAIGLIKAGRGKTRADIMQDIEEAQKYREKMRDAYIEDRVREAIPAFGGGTPGQKQHWSQGGTGENIVERKEVTI